MMIEQTQELDRSLRRRRARRFIGDVGILGTVQLFNRLQGLVLLPFIVHTLGPVGYGWWSQFAIVSSLLSVLVSFSLDDPLVRFVSGARSRSDRQEYFYSMGAMALGANVLAAGLLMLFRRATTALLFGPGSPDSLAVWLGVFLVLSAMDGTAVSMLRALLKLRLFAALEITQTLAVIAAVVAAVWWRPQVEIALAAWLAVQAVWLMAELVAVVWFVGARWPSFRYLRECLAFSLPLIPASYSAAALANLDRIVIVNWLGPEAVGIYNAAYQLATFTQYLLAPMRQALMPTVSRLWDWGRRDEAARYLSYAVKYYLLLAIPAYVGTSLLAPGLLNLLATQQYAAGGSWVVPIAGLGIVFNNLETFFAILLHLHKNTRAIAVGFVVAVAVHVVLLLALVPLLGLLGGALATLVGYALALLVVGGLAWRHSRFGLPWMPSIIFGVASLVMAPLVVWAGAQGGWWGLVIAAMCGAAIYFGLVLVLGGVTWQEVLRLWRALRGT